MNDLKLALRKLAKQKVTSGINIFGFAVAFSIAILLGLYANKEYHTDQFHVNKENIFVLSFDGYSGGCPPLGSFLKETFPEIKSFTRVFGLSGLLRYKQNHVQLSESSLIVADSTFFKVFSFPLRTGNENQVLESNESIVLSRSVAETLFGNEDPIGKQIQYNSKFSFFVNGIMEDIPSNSYIQGKAVICFDRLPEIWGDKELLKTEDNWSFTTFILAAKNSDLLTRNSTLHKIIGERYEIVKYYMKTCRFVPLDEIYFGNIRGWGPFKMGNKQFIYIASVIAILIVVIAAVNYINLVSVSSISRHKEFGLKRLSGANRNSLFANFTFESGLYCIFSFLISMILVRLFIPIFNQLVNTEVLMTELLNFQFMALTVVLVLLVGIFSGIIPGVQMLRFTVSESMKGDVKAGKKLRFQKILIIFQYAVSVTLIIGCLVIAKQTRFLRDHDLGFNQEYILTLPLPNGGDGKLEALGNELNKIASVGKVSFTNDCPGIWINNQSFDYEGKGFSFDHFRCDKEFIEVMEIKLLRGDLPVNSKERLMNETGYKSMNLTDDDLPKKIGWFTLTGIVKDQNTRSLHSGIRPTLYSVHQTMKLAQTCLLKISPENIPATLNNVKKVWEEFNPGFVFEYRFLDDVVDAMYKKEEKLTFIIAYFSMIAIILSGLGILGLVIFSTRQRIKEIGVRKVNGAKVSEILGMLNRDFVKWVVIAFVIATPIAYYAMHKWLENFAYKTTLNWWIFALAGLLALGIALLTVSWQSWKAATRNPVEALRYE